MARATGHPFLFQNGLPSLILKVSIKVGTKHHLLQGEFGPLPIAGANGSFLPILSYHPHWTPWNHHNPLNPHLIPKKFHQRLIESTILLQTSPGSFQAKATHAGIRWRSTGTRPPNLLHLMSGTWFFDGQAILQQLVTMGNYEITTVLTV